MQMSTTFQKTSPRYNHGNDDDCTPGEIDDAVAVFMDLHGADKDNIDSVSFVKDNHTVHTVRMGSSNKGLLHAVVDLDRYAGLSALTWALATLCATVVLSLVIV